MNATYSNGEEYFIYTPNMMAEYNSRTYQRNITARWRKDKDMYVANICLSKPMILDTFQQIAKKAGDNAHMDRPPSCNIEKISIFTLSKINTDHQETDLFLYNVPTF